MGQRKHIKIFNTIVEATAATVYNPVLVKVFDQDNNRLLCDNIGNTDEELEITGTTLSNLGIRKKNGYFKITSLSDDLCTIGLSKNGNPSTPNIEYSHDKKTWYTFTESGGTRESINLNKGETAYFRGDNAYINNSYSSYNYFSISETAKVEGNIMFLLDPTGKITTLDISYCFCYLFKECNKIISAPVLPATTLSDFCYYFMFKSCSNLISAPELPATALTDYCYCGMFQDCSDLVTAPELPATTLVERCYSSMFSDCTSLVTAPELPATTLKDYCYANMFNNCSSLNYIKCLATDISADGCTNRWVYLVNGDGSFVCPNTMRSSWDGKFSGSSKPTNFAYVDA